MRRYTHLALLLIIVGSVLFHWLNPWWTTPLASNWQEMDDTLTITLVITGIFFVAINLFVVYALLRFRHREGRRDTVAKNGSELAGELATRLQETVLNRV